MLSLKMETLYFQWMDYYHNSYRNCDVNGSGYEYG